MKQNFLCTVLLTLAACFIFSLSAGITNDYGILLGSLVANTGLSYAAVSLMIAIGQMFYGLCQPLFGLLAEKRGARLTMLTGVCLILIGLLFLPYCTLAWQLLFCIGILLPAGTGAISFGLLIGSIAPKIPAKSLSLVSGIVNASCGIGSAVFLPATQYLLLTAGLRGAMFILALPAACLIPLCLFISSRSGDAPVAAEPAQAEFAGQSVLGKFLATLKNRTYRLLVLAFFACGFHVSLVYSHLPSQFKFYGIAPETVAMAFSVCGIMTIAGSVFSGWLCGRLPMKIVMGTIFALRVIIVLFFLLLPKTAVLALVFAAFLGLCGESTVPPASGIINKTFGAARLATLFGFAFFIHQLGAFFGAWLGGECFEFFGGYTEIWLLDCLLCAFAALASYRIRENTAN